MHFEVSCPEARRRGSIAVVECLSVVVVKLSTGMPFVGELDDVAIRILQTDCRPTITNPGRDDFAACALGQSDRSRE
jgi:hypothetical protein